MRKKLDIIIPHYDEPYELVRPALDMLRHQQGINYDDIRVILVHDGSEPFEELKNDPFPFDFLEETIPHGGVSAARNKGLDLADAEWVSFYDCDDCLSSVYSLYMILQSLDKEKYDFLWHSFYTTGTPGKGNAPAVIDQFELMWMCAKYFSLDFLREHHIRFNEELEYAEDGAFDHHVWLETNETRIGKINTPFPVYAWLRRMDSATTDAEHLIRNKLHAFRANRYISGLYAVRQRPTTGLMMARTITDAYISLTHKDCEGRPEIQFIEEEVRHFIISNLELLKTVTEKGWAYVLGASIGSHTAQIGVNDDRPTFEEWYNRIIFHSKDAEKEKNT